MYPILFESNYVVVRTYGMIMGIAFLLAYIVMRRYFIRFGLGHPVERFTITVLLVLAGSRFIASPNAPHLILDGRFNFFGGLIGYAIALLVTKKDDQLTKLFDMSTIPVVITYVGASLANIVDHNFYYGTPSLAKWPLAITIEQVNVSQVGTSVWAIPYFSLVAGIFAYVLSKRKYRISGTKFCVTVGFIALVGYGLEHIRGNSTVLTLYAPLIVLILAVIGYISSYVLYKKEINTYV